MHDTSHYWFLAKQHGWGWGFPVLWQGWAVLSLYVISLAVVSKAFSPDRRPGAFFSGVLVLSALFLAVVWATGEPAHWAR
ncbi:hypothetical protein [Paraburkholderia sp.]|uniref:hypothetical protein n=1 Tax=Paraburkholderia sp. TaxID=1926495 RepID=UPI0039E26513